MKLIAIDLDGTLLNSDKRVSFESENYLTELKNQGNIIVIATGRSFKSAFEVTKGASFANYIVCSAGSVIFDNMNKRVLMRATIPSQTTQAILELYHANIEYIDFIDLFEHNRFSVDLEFDDVRSKMNEMHNFLSNKNNVSHICIGFKNDSTASEVNDYILKQHPNLDSYIVHCAYDKKAYVDMVKSGVSKYTGIYEIAKLYGIRNEDIIAIGDSENDLDMIRKSGLSVAMGNAFDIVKQNADYVTKTNDEDGVIEFLKLYL